jgi:hypothetical protein
MFIGTLAVICLSSFTVAAFPQTAVDNAWTVLHTGLSDKSTNNRSVAHTWHSVSTASTNQTHFPNI